MELALRLIERVAWDDVGLAMLKQYGFLSVFSSFCHPFPLLLPRHFPPQIPLLFSLNRILSFAIFPLRLLPSLWLLHFPAGSLLPLCRTVHVWCTVSRSICVRTYMRVPRCVALQACPSVVLVPAQSTSVDMGDILAHPATH
jgi:hypothetical protein